MKVILTLVKQAREQNDIVVMSIFVNPAQFGPGEDFEAYPRDAERDARLAEEAGVDILFMPTARRNVSARRWYSNLAGTSSKSSMRGISSGSFRWCFKSCLETF